MTIIVDSGSTKSDWIIIQNERDIITYSTSGFNPYFHDEDHIEQEINSHAEIRQVANEISCIYYYGAGCSTIELNEIVERALSKVFKNADVHVTHDLNACAYAMYEGKPIISCIMGTGSNSCYFDGIEVTEEVPALAYILGDEGSGSYFGKQLLSKYLYKQLPAHLHQSFYDEYKIEKDDIISNVYFKPHANVYIASFMRFVSKHKTDPFISEMVSSGIEHFLRTHVLCFPNAREVPVQFVGSIAFYFEDILREVGNKLGIHIGKVVKKPIDGLLNYHLHHHPEKILA